MLKKIVATPALVAVLALVGLAISPAFRARMNRTWTKLSGWSEEARQADPVGFSNHVEEKLERDLKVMRQTRKELAGEIGELAKKLREQRALADQALALAEDFRAEFQLASTDGDFPIEVRGAAYTESDARAQVSMLLAEGDGYAESVRKLAEVKQQAEKQMEALAVRINATEAQVTALGTKREMLHARKLSDEGQRLLAQVDSLLNDNARIIEGNPVRTVRELLKTPGGKTENTASQTRVDEFLAVTALPEATAATSAAVPAEQKERRSARTAMSSHLARK